MNPQFLRQRLMRILKRPPELLQALTGHWLTVLLCMTFGVLVGLALAVRTPARYEARALLHVSSSNPLVDVRDRPQFRVGTSSPFVETQRRLILSEPVLRRALQNLVRQPDLVDPDGVPIYDLSGVPDWLQPLAHELFAFFGGGEKVDGLGQERTLQRHVELFRLRSDVVTSTSDSGMGGASESNEIQLSLVGGNRDRLREEITLWINSYRDKVEEIAKARRSKKSDTDIKAADRIVADAELALEEFERANPGLSPERLADKTKDIERLRADRDEIFAKLKSGVPDEEETSDELLLKSYADQIRDAITGSDPQPATSSAVQSLRKRHDEMALKVEETRMRRQAAYDAELAILETKIPGLNRELETEYLAHSKIVSALSARDRLVEVLENAQTAAVEARRIGSLILTSSVVVDSIGDPVVSTDPTKYAPLKKLGLGVLLGLFLTLGVCVLQETLCGRLRNKHDLLSDFGMPVIAVFPK